MYALTAHGRRDAWSNPAAEIVWLDDEVGVVMECGKVIAAVVPLQMLRKMRNGHGSGGGGGGGGGGNAGQLPEVADGPFDAEFAESFDGVLAALRPDLMAKYNAALMRSRVHV